jgi:hypothetical protein
MTTTDWGERLKTCEQHEIAATLASAIADYVGRGIGTQAVRLPDAQLTPPQAAVWEHTGGKLELGRSGLDTWLIVYRRTPLGDKRLDLAGCVIRDRGQFETAVLEFLQLPLPAA